MNIFSPELLLEIDTHKITLINPKRNLKFSCTTEITIDKNNIVTDVGGTTDGGGTIYKPLSLLPLTTEQELMFIKILQYSLYEIEGQKGGLFRRFGFPIKLKIKLSRSLESLREILKSNASNMGILSIEFIN